LKKILFITSEFPPLPGGIGNHAYNLATELHLNNYAVTVITNQRTSDINEEHQFDYTNSFTTQRIKRYRVAFVTYFFRVVKVFQFLCKEKNASILSSGKFSLWITAFSSIFFKNNKSIGILHGSEIRAGGKISQQITQWSLKKFDYLIAVSNFTKEFALQFNSSLNIEVINNGFNNLQNFEPTTHSKIIGNPKIATVGNVTFRKGQQNVINALPKLKEIYPNIHYHIIGIPTQEKEFIALATKLNVLENCTFYGALSNSKLDAVLKQIDVFFMLSEVLENGDFEGFGIAVLEANAMGKPAIGANNSGIQDAIQHQFSGQLVNAKNQDEIAVALQTIMNNYSAYSKNAITWSDNFTWKKIVKKYIEIINQ
jgi:phosphatidylinositol alpha-1,6-mannosyltransferase